MKNPFRRESRNVQNPAYPLTAQNIMSYLGVGQSIAGVEVTPENAERNMAVYRAVNLTASTVASLPLKIYRDTLDGRSEINPGLFQDPIYPDLTWYEALESAVRHLLLYGNAYFLKIPNEAGTATARLLPIHPTQVSVKRVPQVNSQDSGKRFRVQGIDELLTPAELLHIPYVLAADGITGLSPIAVARTTIGTAIAAEEVAAKLFDSGLLQGGILQAEENITDAQAESVKRQWMEKVRGQVRAYEINVLSKGFRWMPATIPPKDAQWIEARRYGTEDIARLFHTPPDLLFENGATGNTNVEQRALTWVKFGLAPLLTRIEDRLSLHLLPRGSFCEFEVVGLLRGDSKTEAEVLAIAIDKGWMTINEVRAIKNLPPLPEPKPVAPPLPVPEPDPGEPAPEPRSYRIKRGENGQIEGLEAVKAEPVAATVITECEEPDPNEFE